MALLEVNSIIQHVKDPYGEQFTVVEIYKSAGDTPAYVIQSERTGERMTLLATPSAMAPWKLVSSSK